MNPRNVHNHELQISRDTKRGKDKKKKKLAVPKKQHNCNNRHVEIKLQQRNHVGMVSKKKTKLLWKGFKLNNLI